MLTSLDLIFAQTQAEGLNAKYHFTFTGAENVEATITIADGRLHVEEGLTGKPDLRMTADSETWLAFVRKERSMPWALLTRKIRIRGNPKLLLAFGKCFPS
jgi:putative sterol carrier protein